MHGSHPECIRRALRLEYFLVGYNILEAIAAIGFGWLAGSIALVGFGLDSIIEVSSAAILIWRLRVHTNPEDEEQREKKALRFVGVTFFLLAAYVGYEASMKLLGHKIPEESIPGIVIAILSVAIMPAIGLKKQKIAKQMGSKALQADAMETLICAYLSVTLLIGLGLNVWRGWWWADPIAALVMLPLILREGWEAFEGSEDKPDD